MAGLPVSAYLWAARLPGWNCVRAGSFCLLALELFCGDDFRVAQVADSEIAEDGDAGQ
jgi:hypothetical protein